MCVSLFVVDRDVVGFGCRIGRRGMTLTALERMKQLSATLDGGSVLGTAPSASEGGSDSVRIYASRAFNCRSVGSSSPCMVVLIELRI